MLAATLACGMVPGALAAQDTTATGRLGPAFATGRLWVLPLPFSPQEIAARMAGQGTPEAIDSMVDDFLSAYLAAAEAARAASTPNLDWTTSLGGQKVGVDPAWIHLGPIRLPTFLLGLLPLNVQANPQQMEQARRWAMMREMIGVQGARDAALDDIIRAARELRQQREDEREFERNQRRPPPATGEGRP